MVEDYKWLIKKYAIGFSRTSSLSSQELEQQAYVIVLEAIASWDPAKGELPPRVKYKLATGLHRYTKQYNTVQNKSDRYEGLDWFLSNNGNPERLGKFDASMLADSGNPERMMMFKEAFLSLSDSAKEVINLLMEEIDTSLHPYYIKGQLVKALRARNYSWAKAYGVIHELKALAMA